MKTKNLISIRQFCEYHHIEHAFILTLNEHDFVELIQVDNIAYIHIDTIPKVEKIMRLHFELSINMEGIDVIVQLLDKIEALQEELSDTKNKLNLLYPEI